MLRDPDQSDLFLSERSPADGLVYRAEFLSLDQERGLLARFATLCYCAQPDLDAQAMLADIAPLLHRT